MLIARAKNRWKRNWSLREWIHQLRAGGSGHDQSYASRTGSQSHSARQWSEILDQPRNTKVLDESRRYCPPKSSSGDHIERQTLAPVQFAMQHPETLLLCSFFSRNAATNMQGNMITHILYYILHGCSLPCTGNKQIVQYIQHTSTYSSGSGASHLRNVLITHILGSWNQKVICHDARSQLFLTAYSSACSRRRRFWRPCSCGWASPGLTSAGNATVRVKVLEQLLAQYITASHFITLPGQETSSDAMSNRRFLQSTSRFNAASALDSFGITAWGFLNRNMFSV